MASKLHPLTVPVRGASRALGLAIAGSVLGSVLQESLAATGFVPRWLPPAGPILAVLLAAGALLYEGLRYWLYRYELTGNTLTIESGVLFRREREIPLGRIQNVDITRSIVQRVLDVAAVGIETAGGRSTEATLRFVSRDEALRLQEGIRTRKRTQPADTADETGSASDERERLFELDDEDLLVYSLLGFDPRLLSVLFVVVPTVAPLLSGYVEGRAAAVVAVFGLFGVALLGIGVWILSAFRRFVGYYGFTLTRVGGELRYERGLLQRYDGSIPEGKIQTVVVEENLLMRRFDYASLSIETAGYGPNAESGSESAIPLARREQLLALAREVEDFGELSFQHPAPEARRRYAVRYALLVTGLLGAAFAASRVLVPYPWYGLAALYALVPLAARKTWLHRGWDLLDGYVATRAGFWRRRTHVVPDDRIQTVVDRRTLFQRRWHLGTVVIDTASSGGFDAAEARAIDVSDTRIEELREAVAEKLLRALGLTRSGSDPRD
ncbi:MAG: PH domain-containing protein [Halodesulfurarchaeum sp.]